MRKSLIRFYISILSIAFFTKSALGSNVWEVPVEETAAWLGLENKNLLLTFNVSKNFLPLGYVWGGKNLIKAGYAYCVEKDVSGSCDVPDMFPTNVTCAPVKAKGGDTVCACECDSDFVKADDMRVYCHDNGVTDIATQCVVVFTADRFLYTALDFFSMSIFVLVVVLLLMMLFSENVRKELKLNYQIVLRLILLCSAIARR